jgi:hypothetical protein
LLLRFVNRHAGIYADFHAFWHDGLRRVGTTEDRRGPLNKGVGLIRSVPLTRVQ